MKKNNKLVSLITPVYNGGNDISYLLDSVLNQNYPEIEHVIVDDGSTDDTSKIVDKYINKYKNRGKVLKYYYIPNSGQSVAINLGLNHIKGDYLSWPDSDDYYSNNDSIYKMVYVLNSDKYNIVRTNGEYVKEDRKTIIKSFSDTSDNPFKEDLFEDCLMKHQFWFSHGSSLVNVNALKKVLNDFQIINSRVGQNYQIFLPLFYSFKCKYLDEKHYRMVVRKGSHSRRKLNFKQKKKNLSEKENLLKSILMSIKMPESKRKYYLNKVKYRYSKEISNLSKEKRKILYFIIMKIRQFKYS